MRMNAQQFLFRNMNELKLPAQECYNITQDKKGYIWFSTEGGLCRYNGNEVKVFNANKGLPENSCYGICEHTNGKLYFITNNNRVLYYDEKTDSLIETGFSKRIKAITDKSKLTQLYFIQQQNDSLFWLCTQGQSYSANIFTNDVRQVKCPDEKDYFLKAANTLLPIKNAGTNRKNIKAQINICLIDKKDTICNSVKWSNTNVPQWRCLTAKNITGDYFIGWDNKLIRIKKDNTFETYTTATNILNVYTGITGDLWVGTLKGGLLYFKNGELMGPMISLNDLSVTGICEDYENGLWCSTLEKGIYYSRNKNVIDYSNVPGLNRKPELFKVIDEKLFYSSTYETIFEVRSTWVKENKMKFINGTGASDIWLYENNYLIASRGFVAKTDTNFKNVSFYRQKGTNAQFGARTLSITKEGRVFMIQNSMLLELVNNYIVPDKIWMPSGCNGLLFTSVTKVLLACRDGLYKGDINLRTSEKIGNIDCAVTDIIRTQKDKIWIATKDKGLFTLNGEELKNVSDALQLKDQRFYDLCEDKNGTIWAASNKGLVKMDAEKNKAIIYNRLSGLASDDIYNVSCTGDKIYYSTSEGLGSFALEQDLKNERKPMVYISSININGGFYNVERLQGLSHYKNSLRIKVDALTFKEPGECTLYYVLKGTANKTNEADSVTGNELILDNLEPNRYELSVWAVNANGVRSEKPALLNFEILKPFWQTLWFMGVCIVLFGVILYFTTTAFIKRIKKREEEKTEINNLIAESQLSALQAQMNPHFIFNAINSIQRYILEKSKQEAYDYLAKFSKLIRMVLNNSEEKILPIEKEIETIKLYVELEQLRFKNSFDFVVEIDEELDTYKTQIPSMLIQPYIENAIWHGLMHLDGLRKGKLSLKFKMNGEQLKITVEDNGIGREKAKEYKKDAVHKSVGMKITEQRLAMINKMESYEDVKVMVSDLQENEIECGTRVEIFLPMNYEN